MKNKGILTVLVSVLTFVLLINIISCEKDPPIIPPPDDEWPGTTPWEWPLEKLSGAHFPTKMNIPANNPMTVEGVAFGRWLFYDGRVSGRTDQDSLMSCATCHIQEYAFTCGKDHPDFLLGRPHGLTGINTPLSMLPMINLVFNSNGYLWSGKIREENTFLWKGDPKYHMLNLESLVWMGIVAPHEMKGHPDKTTELLNTVPEIKELCYNAFGDSTITYERMSKAVAQFVRTLISYNSGFHKYLRGEQQLTSQELNGYLLFVDNQGADCFHCHGGDGNPLFTTNLFYNNGLDDTINENTYTRDRYHITFDPKDIGAFKATTLINCESYGPYMHDGRFQTLEEVIDQYSDNVKNTQLTHPLMELAFQGGAKLTPQEKADLLAFLKTLTDHEFLTNPDFGKPPGLDDKWVNQK